MAGERVMVAMSGGVDSSVAAALLVEQGYDVIGVTLQVWPAGAHPPGRHVGCCSLEAVDDARRVADRLGIPYYVLNFQERFQEAVIGPFTRAYLAGQTPNPCIWCNERIKFGALLDQALGLGAHLVATGHYARVYRRGADGRWVLARAADAAKDQTYALWPLAQAQLAHVQFPLAPFTKPEVREMARRWGLPVASKPESQEICFIPDDDYRGFLRQQVPEALAPGPIVDTEGRVLGRHPGVAFFTVGQRKGLGVATGRPLYVVALIPETRTVVVGPKEAVGRSALVATGVNWIAISGLDAPLRVTAKIRRSAAEVPATISPLPDGGVLTHFDTPQWAVTPGQSVVWYREDEVVGGAYIARVLETAEEAAVAATPGHTRGGPPGQAS